MEVVMIRWANDDAPVPTSSELFFKILTLSHSVSLLTPRANHNCDSDTAPEIEASGLFVDPQRAAAAAEERRSRARGRGKLRRA